MLVNDDLLLKEPEHQKPWYWPGTLGIFRQAPEELTTINYIHSVIGLDVESLVGLPSVAFLSWSSCWIISSHDNVIKWKYFLRYWPFVRGLHRSPVNSPHKVQWRETLMFSLIWARINCWINNREAGDLRRHRAHYDVIVMQYHSSKSHVS